MNAPLSDAQRALMERLLRGEGASVLPPRIQRRPEGAIVPLSAAQRQVWLDAALAPHAPIYNESITIHRHGPCDPAALEASLNAFVRRHEAFRTSFALDGADPVQIIHPKVAIPLTLDDVSNLPEADRDAAATAIATADAIQPIDMAAAPLLRARLVKIADDDHRLYLTIHHIIFDGVTISRILLPELARLYAAFACGSPSPLPDPQIGYGDYTLWHDQHLREGGVERQLAHWRTALADAPPRFDLPGDRPRPAAPTRAGSMETFTVPLDLTERLRRLAAEQGATLYMVLLAAFTALLHRCSGEQDIVIGGVTDLRRRPELHDVVGYFLNTFALRTRPYAELPFDAHLAQVRGVVAGALDASEVPFDEVLRALELRRATGGHPLFSILFSIEPPADPFPDGWDLTQMDVVVGGAKFDLYFELDERPEGLAARFLYSTELFDRTTIRRMIGQWLTLLEGIVAAPRGAIGTLPLLTTREADRLDRWNATARNYPAQTLPAMIAAQARRTPDAPAIFCEGREWTYRALDAHACRISTRLAAAGIGRGSLVAVALDRSPELVAALLGILRAGAAYLPLDANQPRARIARIVEDAAPDLLFTQHDLIDALPIDGPPILLVDHAMKPATGAPPAGPEPDDLAYVIYTSGSTGLPKGVEIDHAALANFIRAMQDRPGFTGRDSLLAVTTVTFDIAALELFLPLASGGRVVIAPVETAHDPVRLMALMAAQRPSVMQATPATWLALLEAGWEGDRDLAILCGGEAMPRTLADRLLDRCAALWNMYGPTEATIWATLERIDRSQGPVAIGQPIANMTADILDAANRPVPAGIVGELYLGGIGLARGYRGQEALTIARFRDVAGQRLYRTGDLARRRSDGSLVWLGRADNEEKIRGYRVAVEEVEGALAALPGVAAAAVRGWPDPSGMRTLAAYVVSSDDQPADVAALRLRLGELLPDYMVPGRFVFLDTLPMTASGKIDRAALPAPASIEPARAFTPPTGADEERLAALWRDVLKLENFDRTDSFFELGGHSLLATHLLRRIEAEYDRRMDMAGLFRAHRFDMMVAALAAPPIDPELVLPIQPLGSRPPLFWLGAGPAQLELSRQLGLDQPLLGIPIGAMAEADPDRSFADHAAEVVRRMRIVQPDGPYLVGGWCTAGILAFEVGRQLRAAGADVPILFIGDSIDPSWHGDSLRRVRYHLRRLAAGPDEGRLPYLWEQISKTLAWWGLLPQKPVPAKDDGGAALDDSARRYRPGSYAGDVVLFRAADWDARLGQGGWPKHMTGAIADHVFPGDHETFFRPGKVDAFAALLRDRLAGPAR
jgi:amino acid adenylation domain-containing protein